MNNKLLNFFYLLLLIFQMVVFSSQSYAESSKGLERIKAKSTFIQESKVAVVIGVNSYDSNSGLRPLRYAVADAKLLKATLKKQGYKVRLLINHQANNNYILNAIKQAGKTLKNKGTLLFFYSGHGFASGNKNYLASYGTVANDLASSGLSLDILRHTIQKTGVQRVIMFIDACRNNPNLEGSKSVKNTSFTRDNSEGVRILYSTKYNEVSWEASQLGHGVFSYFLNKGLNGAAADNEGIISFSSIKKYVQQEVASWTFEHNMVSVQKPFSIGDSFGVFVLGYNSYEGETHSLTIKTTPKADRVKILNIIPTYKDKILLKPGKYHVEVSKKGYQTTRRWIELKNTSLVVNLNLKKYITKKYIFDENPRSNNLRSSKRWKIKWEKFFSSKKDPYIQSGESIFAATFLSDRSIAMVGLTDVTDTSFDSYILLISNRGNKIWEKKIDNGGMNDRALAVSSLSDNGLVIAGYHDRYMTSNMYVTRLDKYGNILWTTEDKSLDYQNRSEANALLTLRNDDIVVAGYKSDESYTGDLNTRDMLIFKLDKNGKRKWLKIFKGKEDESVASIALYDDGGFILVGSSSDEYLSSDVETGIRIRRLNRNGRQIWSKYIHTKGMNLAPKSVVISNGNIIISSIENNHTYKDTHINLLSLNRNGDKIWEKRYSSKKTDLVSNLATLPTGDIILTGSTYAHDIFAELFVIHLNKNGEILWEKTFKDGQEDNYKIVLSSGKELTIIGKGAPKKTVNNISVLRLTQ